jgi:hypothetical protein
VEFPDESAVVAGLGDQLASERRVAFEGFVPITRVVRAGRVKAGHKARPAWGANRALAISVCKSSSAFDEGINGRGADMRIAECSDGVEALLIGTVPENIGAFVHGVIVAERGSILNSEQ